MKRVKDTIQRMTMVNPSKVEYADRCVNHVQGCSHGCKYCYAAMMSKRIGTVSTYEEWREPKLVSNTLELIAKEIPKLKPGTVVHFSFMTDPFMYGYPEVCDMSLAAITMLNNAGIKCTTLTKGILPIEMSYLSKENEHGITLVSLDERFREKYEPGAAPLVERLASLWTLHQLGCKTWVSIEPFFTPNVIAQDLQQLLSAVGFVDRIIFGRANYCPDVTAYSQHKQFYNEKAMEVIRFCEARGIAYHIKKGTLT